MGERSEGSEEQDSEEERRERRVLGGSQTFLTSLSLTDRLANLNASSKCLTQMLETVLLNGSVGFLTSACCEAHTVH